MGCLVDVKDNRRCDPPSSGSQISVSEEQLSTASCCRTHALCVSILQLSLELLHDARSQCKFCSRNGNIPHVTVPGSGAMTQEPPMADVNRVKPVQLQDSLSMPLLERPGTALHSEEFPTAVNAINRLRASAGLLIFCRWPLRTELRPSP